MRISDWSSDVCSSDLNGTSSAALVPKMPTFPPAVTSVRLLRCAVTRISSVALVSCAIAGADIASTAIAADRPSALRKVDLVTDIPLQSAALPRASCVSGSAGAHCPADGQYRQGGPDRKSTRL